MTIDIVRRGILTFVGLLCIFGRPSSAGILEDVTKSATDAVDTLNALGYHVDFSFESIEHLERFMADNVLPEGGPRPNSQLSDKWGGKLFMLGSYLGEVIRRKTNGQWRGDDNDPEVDFNVEVVTSSGARIWPMQRIVRRFQNGGEDNLWDYARLVIEP